MRLPLCSTRDLFLAARPQLFGVSGNCWRYDQVAGIRNKDLSHLCWEYVRCCVAKGRGDAEQDYMTVIFQRTTQSIKNEGEPDDVRMAAIEFWSAIAFSEQELLERSFASHVLQ
jgi:hypothetical protein